VLEFVPLFNRFLILRHCGRRQAIHHIAEIPSRCCMSDTRRARRPVRYWRLTETVVDADQPPCNITNRRCQRWSRARASTHIYMKRAAIPASCTDRNASGAKGAHVSFFPFRIPWSSNAQRDFLVLWRPWPLKEARDQLFARLRPEHVAYTRGCGTAPRRKGR